MALVKSTPASEEGNGSQIESTIQQDPLPHSYQTSCTIIIISAGKSHTVNRAFLLICEKESWNLVYFCALKSQFGDPYPKGSDHLLGTRSSPQPTNLWLKGNVRSQCPPTNQGSLPGIWWPNLTQVLPARTKIKGRKNF